MKKFCLFLALAVGMSVVACTKPPVITPDPANLSFTAAGGSQNVTLAGVESGVGLNATTDVEWCTTSTNGTTLIVTVSANTDEASRSTIVKVTYQGGSANINVEQSGFSANVDGLLNEVNAPAGGGEISLGTVVSDIAPVVSSPVDWITNPIVSETGEITVTVAANNTGAERRAAVAVKVGAEDYSVNLIQSAVTIGGDFTAEPDLTQQASIPGYAVVVVEIELTGTADDFYFGTLPSELATADEQTRIDYILANPNIFYTKEVYDSYISQYGFFFIELKQGSNYQVALLPMDGNEHGNLVVKEVNLDPDTPDQAYTNWVGTWNIRVQEFANSENEQGATGRFKDTVIVIAQDVANASFRMNYWEGLFTSEDQEPWIPVAFDVESGNMQFQGVTTEFSVSFTDGSSAQLSFFAYGIIEQNAGVSLITGSGYPMAEAVYGETINLVPLEIEVNGLDEPFVPSGMAVFGDMGNSQWASLSDPLWAFPITMTMSKVSSSTQPFYTDMKDMTIQMPVNATLHMVDNVYCAK